MWTLEKGMGTYASRGALDARIQAYISRTSQLE